MKKVVINTEFITLGQLLKLENFISSGGEAKIFLASNLVWVDGELDNRRGRKLYPQMTVKIANKEFVIAHASQA